MCLGITSGQNIEGNVGQDPCSTFPWFSKCSQNGMCKFCAGSVPTIHHGRWKVRLLRWARRASEWSELLKIFSTGPAAKAYLCWPLQPLSLLPLSLGSHVLVAYPLCACACLRPISHCTLMLTRSFLSPSLSHLFLSWFMRNHTWQIRTRHSLS